MNCKLGKLEIPADQPFLNCKLGREKYAEVLKAIITTYKKGFVLAIDGKWGTGKTTFVEMWKAYLELDKFHTLYFNAWENDFISDPLVGLIGELTKINSSKRTKDLASSMINTAGRIVLKAVPEMFKGVINKQTGEEVVEVLYDCIGEGSSMLKKEIDNYERQKESLLKFREDLEIFVNEVCEKKPLIFIIDELDRCNPHYAVKVLERIKHLFNIPNIIFVLSIDKEQLSNSIRGYYGSDLINANEYLKRFIDIEYALPDPDVEKFCSYLYDYYGFEAYEKARGTKEMEESILTIANTLFMHKNLSLRQIEKIFAHIRLSLNMYKHNQVIYAELICLLTYLRICESDCYVKITHESYTIQELTDQLESIIPKQILQIKKKYESSPSRQFHFTIALLLRCYTFKYENSDENDKLLTRDPSQPNLVINFNVKTINKELLSSALEWTSQRNIAVPLHYFTQRINLLENFAIYNIE